MVDIQAKLQAGKGAGYARWAKTFNLKQMAQTLNYLTEHGLLDYADLSAKADEATGRYHELSATIKAAEQRMAEIAVLKTHIINYAKTREVYMAYRKAGYSKKFKAEHESDILLHQAAKKFFDESGLKKLPAVRSLQAEYAALPAEKKAAYADFRKARDEMKELLTVRANVDRLIGDGGAEPNKETEHQEERAASPGTGLFKGAWGPAPNKQNEHPTGRRDVHFSHDGTIMPCLPVFPPLVFRRITLQPIIQDKGR